MAKTAPKTPKSSAIINSIHSGCPCAAWEAIRIPNINPAPPTKNQKSFRPNVRVTKPTEIVNMSTGKPDMVQNRSPLQISKKQIFFNLFHGGTAAQAHAQFKLLAQGLQDMGCSFFSAHGQAPDNGPSDTHGLSA
jgi:hypothetical protein